MRAKTVYEVKLAELIKNTPNDADLGKALRRFHDNYDYENEEKVRLEMMMETLDVIKSGYAGVISNGNIVDRRKHLNAMPIPENPLFCTPKPKEI